MDKYNYLSDVEKEKITAFMADEIMSEAVKKVLLFDLYQNGVLVPGEKAIPLRNAALGLFFAHQGEERSNQALGEELRAMAEGITTVENAFNEMETIAKPERSEKGGIPSNMAR